MGKQDLRKSGEGVAVNSPKATPKKGATPKTPKKGATPKTPKKGATPKKVFLQGESPKQLKNKPLKTPIKHKAPKNPSAAETPKKQKRNALKTNGASPKKRTVNLIPQELSKNLSRRQKKRIVHKIAKVLKIQGTEDLTKIDPNDASIKEIFEKIVMKDTTGVTDAKDAKSNKTKAKVVKQERAVQDDDSEEKGALTKTPIKKPFPKKTPKKSPKAN